MASIDWAKATARRDEKISVLRFGVSDIRHLTVDVQSRQQVITWAKVEFWPRYIWASLSHVEIKFLMVKCISYESYFIVCVIMYYIVLCSAFLIGQYKKEVTSPPKTQTLWRDHVFSLLCYPMSQYAFWVHCIFQRIIYRYIQCGAVITRSIFSKIPTKDTP